jgi:hypothetical protein
MGLANSIAVLPRLGAATAEVGILFSAFGPLAINLSPWRRIRTKQYALP